MRTQTLASRYIGGVFAAAALFGAASVAVASDPTDEAGWTVLSPAAGAQTIYVSSSTGSDTNSGLSAASPVKSLARGYNLLRDGQPDWLVLKSGDTWNEAFPFWRKSANSTTAYMVVTSYGTGPRPKLRTPPSESAINLGTQDRSGLAFIDLDLQPSTPGGSNFSGAVVLGHWRHVLFEGLLVSQYPGNFVIQDVNQLANTMDDIKIRRCVIVDSYDTGSGHSQGIFLRDTTNWLIEGCILDNNARNKADIFCHNVYVNEGSGQGIFRDNISSRACSHGIQQRPGGDMINNLFMQNPINAYQSRSGTPGTNTFSYNVALDSRDINTTDVRGSGFELDGTSNNIVEYNVAAHQKSGTANIYAFVFNGFNAATVRGNFVYDWVKPGASSCNAVGMAWFGGGSGSILVENNKLYQRNGYGQIISHSQLVSSRFTYRTNKYFSSSPGAPACYYSAFDVASGSGGDFNFWRTRTGDTTSTYADPGQMDVSIDAYMQSMGTPGDLVGFLAQARQQSKQNWRTQFTSTAVNDWVRARVGITTGGATCYANCDGSAQTPVLNTLDFQCFLNHYAMADAYANCDNSVAPPMVNVSDFTCFMNKYAAGCP